MPPPGELLLAIVAIGAVSFGMAALAMISGVCQNTIDRHMLQVRAMEQRNQYIRSVMALRGEPLEVEPIEQDEAPEPLGRTKPEQAPSRPARAAA